jgi:protein kinase/serine/threonine-protein kinase
MRPETMKGLLREIHRRSVWQVLLVYVGVSWAVIEAIQGLTDATGLPVWFPPFAVGLLLIGLPVVLATAVVQHGASSAAGAEDPGGGSETGAESAPLTAGGNTSTDAAPRPSAARRLLTWRNAIGGGVLAMALWGVVATAWILTGARGINFGPGSATHPLGDVLSAGAITVAVLPFANMSPDEDNAFFAAGIHEDILTHLSKIAALTVISRTSVNGYADTEKSVRQIGDELGANTILEGSVRRAGDKVRITTQLIDTRTDAHLWAETYDRELVDVFEIQSDIARRVAGALEATLSPAEEARIAASPTSNLTAYDLYLRGRESYGRHTVEDHRESIRLFKAALEMDPGFALALAGLADAYAQASRQYGWGPAYADSALAAAQEAVRLDPHLSEAHKALGFALQGTGDNEGAVEAYRSAVEINPNDFAAVNNIGTIVSGMGALDEALVWYRRASRLAPEQEYPRTNAAELYTMLGDYETADRWLRDAALLHPEGTSVFQQRSYWHLWQGDAQAAYENALRAVESVPEHPGVHAHAGLMALFDGQPERARTHLEESFGVASAGGWELHLHHIQLAAALARVGEAAASEERLALAESRLQDFRHGDGVPEWVYWERAAVAAVRGEAGKAVELAREAHDRGYRYGIHPDDPVFESVREDPGFQAVMADFASDYARMRASMEATERAEGIR